MTYLQRVPGGASSYNSSFGVNKKSDTIAENEYLIPQVFTYENKNDNPMGVELIVKLTNIGQGYFISGNYMVESKALEFFWNLGFITKLPVLHRKFGWNATWCNCKMYQLHAWRSW